MRIPSHLIMTGQIADQSAKRKTIATDDLFRKDIWLPSSDSTVHRLLAFP